MILSLLSYGKREKKNTKAKKGKAGEEMLRAQRRLINLPKLVDFQISLLSLNSEEEKFGAMQIQ